VKIVLQIQFVLLHLYSPFPSRRKLNPSYRAVPTKRLNPVNSLKSSSIHLI
jgi:hypothetical protein